MSTDPFYTFDTRYTYGDYCQWSGDERWELIGGVVYAMSPSPKAPHERFGVNLVSQLEAVLEGHPCEAFTAPIDVLLHEGDERDEDVLDVVQPDVFVVCDPDKVGEWIRGAPDFVVEILSPSTEARDRNEKARLYARAGVREYWIADVTQHTVSILQLEKPGQWKPPVVVGAVESQPVTALPGVTLKLARAFAAAERVSRRKDQPSRPAG